MDWKLELVAIPVSDVDRAKAFYVDKAGFNADHDHAVSDEVRFVQLTPRGSACSITIGKGVTDAPPGSVQGMQMVVPDIEAAHAELAGRGVEVSDIRRLSVGLVRVLLATRTATSGPFSRSSPARREATVPDLKLELVLIPVSDVDRAKAFYTEKLGFSLDVDHAPSDEFRVVQMTPPGSACSITHRSRDHGRGAGLVPRHAPRRDRHRGRAGGARLARRRGRRCAGTSTGSRASGSLAQIPSTASTPRSRTSRTRTATRGSCRRCPRARSRRLRSTSPEGVASRSPDRGRRARRALSASEPKRSRTWSRAASSASGRQSSVRVSWIRSASSRFVSEMPTSVIPRVSMSGAAWARRARAVSRISAD